MTKKVVFGAELPEEVSAFFCANSASDAQLSNVHVDVHFNFNAPAPISADETSRVEMLEKLLDTMQDNDYRPTRFMPQSRCKSMVIVLCLNFFMHMWKLAGRSQAQYEKIPKASIARLIAYITGIDVRYVEDLIPSKNQTHRFVRLLPDKRKELERLLLDVTDMPLRGTKELLMET